MASVNKVIIIGNVGKDPEIRSFGNGGQAANFSVATSERWKDKSTGEYKERTEWHKISVTNEALVSVVQRFVRKGSKVCIEGALQTRSYDKDGVTHHSTEVVVKPFSGNITLLDKLESNEQPAEQAKPARKRDNGYAEGNPNHVDLDDEIPF